jgi:hypothetical protein
MAKTSKRAAKPAEKKGGSKKTKKIVYPLVALVRDNHNLTKCYPIMLGVYDNFDAVFKAQQCVSSYTDAWGYGALLITYFPGDGIEAPAKKRDKTGCYHFFVAFNTQRFPVNDIWEYAWQIKKPATIKLLDPKDDVSWILSGGVSPHAWITIGRDLLSWKFRDAEVFKAKQAEFEDRIQSGRDIKENPFEVMMEMASIACSYHHASPKSDADRDALIEKVKHHLNI